MIDATVANKKVRNYIKDIDTDDIEFDEPEADIKNQAWKVVVVQRGLPLGVVYVSWYGDIVSKLSTSLKLLQERLLND